MGTSQILPCAVLQFGKNDPAAAPAGALLPILGIADLTDQTLASITMPFAGAIYAVMCQAGPAAGDTVAFQASINAALVGALVSSTNAAPQGRLALTAPIRFNAGDAVGITYATTTGGVYAVNDVSCQVLVGFDIPNPVATVHV